jgi:hypothetical protein
MNKIKTVLSSLGVALLMLVPLGMCSHLAYADVTPTDTPLACGTRNGTWDSAKSTCSIAADGSGDNKTIQDDIAKVINILSWVVGVISVIMIIIAGFKYVTSGGNEKGVSGAKSTIMYAIVGLVVVALAQVIVRFVLGNIG